MKQKIELLFCDVCKVDQNKAYNFIAKEKCASCDRDLCMGECFEADDYRTTSHFPEKYGTYPIKPIICKICWEAAHIVDYSKIKKGIDIHASGSSWAIRLGEYVHMIYKEKMEEVKAVAVEEIKRLVALGADERVAREKKALLLEKAEKLRNKAYSIK